MSFQPFRRNVAAWRLLLGLAQGLLAINLALGVTLSNGCHKRFEQQTSLLSVSSSLLTAASLFLEPKKNELVVWHSFKVVDFKASPSGMYLVMDSDNRKNNPNIITVFGFWGSNPLKADLRQDITRYFAFI